MMKPAQNKPRGLEAMQALSGSWRMTCDKAEVIPSE